MPGYLMDGTPTKVIIVGGLLLRILSRYLLLLIRHCNGNRLAFDCTLIGPYMVGGRLGCSSRIGPDGFTLTVMARQIGPTVLCNPLVESGRMVGLIGAHERESPMSNRVPWFETVTHAYSLEAPNGYERRGSELQ
ncbi:hypothetical protein G9A89_000473 [Geosiphon pyriformis]|nr:hypothetical protein G9A89_000473 [Geosiphon pyriformis]